MTVLFCHFRKRYTFASGKSKIKDMNTLFIHILLCGLIIILLEKPMGSGSCA